MIFEHTLTIDAGRTQAAPASTEMKLTKGIIHKVEITGDGGEHNLVFVVIRRGYTRCGPLIPMANFIPAFSPSPTRYGSPSRRSLT